MSTNSIQSLKVVGLYDKRINAHAADEQYYVAHKGASIVTLKPYTTTSFSTSSWQFSTPPPNNKIFIDRQVWVKLVFQVLFDVDVSTGLGANLGLRQWPINSIIETVNCNINNNQVTVVTGDIVHALTRYSTNKCRQDKVNSLSASMPDQYQDYATWASPLVGGSARNPLAAYGEQFFQNRGAITPDSISMDGKTLTYTVMEPLFLLSPFIYEEEEHLGLVNVTTMDWNFNLKSNLGARMFSNDQLGPNIGSATVSISTSPELHFTYLTPPLTMFIPDSISYPYYNIVRYTSSDVTLASGASTTTTTNNIQLTEIPKRVYVYIRRRNQSLLETKGFNYTDTFASITNVTVTFNNLSSMFSTFQQQDLYNLSRKNGLQMSWSQFKNFCGSVICFEPSYDFGLPSILSAGSLGQFNLQITLAFTNTSSAEVIYSPYIVVCNEGIITVGSRATTVQTGVLSRAAVLNSENLPQVDYDMVENRGGSIFGRLKSFFQKAKPFLNQVSRGLETVGSVGSTLPGPYGEAFKIASRVGSLGRSVTGGRTYKRRGKGLVGA